MPPLLLPQHDGSSQRAEDLKIAQSAWIYGCWQKLHCFAKRVPRREMPKIAWILKVLPGVGLILANRVRYWFATHFPGELHHYRFKARRGRLGASRLVGVPEALDSEAGRINLWRVTRVAQLLAYRGVDGLIGRVLARDASGSAPSTPLPATSRGASLTARKRPNVTIEDFKKIYQFLPMPPLAAQWTNTSSPLTDQEFVWQRLAGPNPEMLQRTDEVPAEFPPDLATKGIGTLAQIAAAGGLFVADYAPLSKLVNSTWHDLPRFVSASRALFDAKDGKLQALAIQCAPGGGIFRPGDAGWELAKHVVQVADGNYHELIAHLGRTHLLVEIFLMATRRNLAPNHPLHRLLVPHFEGTVFINDSARNGLIAPGGAIDQIFAGTIESSTLVAIASLQTLDLGSYDLPTRTAMRGVDASLIAEYPWRDDALALWTAIEGFVRDYAQLFYKTEADILQDTELYNWSAALSQPVGEGGVPGFSPPTSVEELVRIVTLVIYTASAQHAAVNFPQYPVMSFSPMVAGSGWAPGPDVAPPASLVEFLPPRQLALSQAETLYLLSSVHHTRLGYYVADWFGEPAVDAVVAAFQRELARIEATIQVANATRRSPYTHLLPSLIPQSINI